MCDPCLFVSFFVVTQKIDVKKIQRREAANELSKLKRQVDALKLSVENLTQDVKELQDVNSPQKTPSRSGRAVSGMFGDVYSMGTHVSFIFRGYN